MSPDWVAWFRDAGARHGVVTRYLEIAGRSLRLEVAGSAIDSLLYPAFAPLIRSSTPAADSGQLFIWSDEDRGRVDFGPATGQVIRIPEGGLLISHAVLPAAEAFSPDRTIMLWGTPEAFTCGDIRVQPASTAIAAWLAQGDAFGLHVGAVGYESGAALLVGRSGAGKSTTVLACAAQGLRVLGDDFCITTMDSIPTVHGVYATAKIKEDSERRLELTAHPTLGYTSNHKKVLALGDGAFLPSAPIIAIIVLAKADNHSQPAPLSRNDTLRALVPTAPKAAMGAYPLDRWLQTAASLARQVPGFLVNLNWELECVVRSVNEVLTIGGTALRP